MARRNNMTRKNRNRKNRKSMKGGADAPAPSTANPAPAAPEASASASQSGGKRRKSRKLSSGARAWQDHMMKTYREMKARDSSTRLGDAMKAAKKTFRK